MQVVSYSVLITAAILAALIASFSLVGSVQLTSRRTHGYMHLIFCVIPLMVGVATLLSGRDITSTSLSFDDPTGSTRHPLLAIGQPLASLLMLTVASERIISRLIKHSKSAPIPIALMTIFIVFWLGTVAVPALLGAHPRLSHDYAYTLIIGIAAVLSTELERDLAVRATRNTLLLFMAVSLVLVPIKPSLVLDTSYGQGLLPGVPRLAGLAVHAVSLGILSQIGLLCLIAYPYRRVWLNRMAWFIGLTALFFAQSKTSWISFVLCLMCFIGVRHASNLWRRVGDPVRPEFGVMSILMFMLAVLGAALLLMFGDIGSKLDSFLNSATGAQLASLTGRDTIWSIAYEEWQRNPVFGYGPTIWDASFRTSIGMPNAIHAHNQFMDTLSRSGAVGATALALYALSLLFMSLRYARASRGLTLALFVALALRSMSEVPLSLFGYGSELVTHLLLLITLAAYTSVAKVRKVPTVASPIRPVSSYPRTARDPLANSGLNS